MISRVTASDSLNSKLCERVFEESLSEQLLENACELYECPRIWLTGAHGTLRSCCAVRRVSPCVSGYSFVLAAGKAPAEVAVWPAVLKTLVE